jgi:hypothetical protein
VGRGHYRLVAAPERTGPAEALAAALALRPRVGGGPIPSVASPKALRQLRSRGARTTAERELLTRCV